MGHFGFTKLIVGDLDASAKFYEAVMGLKVQARIDAELGGRAITEIVYEATAPGGANFVLINYHDTKKTPAGELIIGYVATDIDAFLKTVTEHGGAVTLAPFQTEAAGAMKVAFATDPDGHVIEVIQPL